MGALPGSGEGSGFGLRDLVSFNRWLCMTRLRAAGAVFVFALVLRALGAGEVLATPVLAVCAGLAVVSVVGLCTPALARAPRLFFYLQSLADLAGITLGIASSIHGQGSLLFRPIYGLVIVPASLISVPSGLAMALAATAGHELVLGLERGFSLATALSVESLTPPFLFFLLAQQCFYYGAHLEGKNTALGGLAARLEENRRRLVSEARTSAALLDVARTLGSTLEAPELLARVNCTTRQQLGAEWSATFLVDAPRATFRLVAVTDTETSSDLGRLEFPMRGWSPVGRLVREPVVILTGPDAERTPGMFASGRCLATVILAGFYRDDALIGFLAVGYATLAPAEREQALDLLTGIAQHVTIVLRNAELLEEVRQASAMKSEFVGAISHELRSPLNVVLGYLEMLLDQELGAITGDQRDALVRTRQQSVALLEMISALLDLNRLEAGRLPVHCTPVSIPDLLEDTCQQLPENWRRPDVQLQITVAAGLPSVETDAAKLKTIVRNLLHNAFKFTERGVVTLAADLTEHGDLRLTVTDTGCGIPPEAITYIFEMFRQVPGTGGGGVGLGLHLVRRLLQVLGGTVSVTSDLGKGTCFTITLPRAAAPALSREPAAALSDASAHAA
jgi:signal transduction histidine kinase